jgi:diguanylate cyclase
VSASIGVAQHRGAETPDELFARADAALFAAKESGRDRVEVAR